MRVLGTTTHYPLSKLITWGMGARCTHVAVQFDSWPIVIHSNVFGAHPELAYNFNSSNIVVRSIPYRLTEKQETQILRLMLSQMGASKYDWLALAYFLWRGALYKFFGLPLPKRNLWQTKQSLLCTEVTYLLNWAYQSVTGRALYTNEADLSIMTPDSVLEMLNQERCKWDLSKQLLSV